MGDAPLLSTTELIAMQRKVSVPFRVKLDDDILVCDTLLRVLPGKRLVCHATWRGQEVLAKIYLSHRATQHLNREVQGQQRLLDARLPAAAVLTTGQLPDGVAQVLLLQYFTNTTDFSVRWRKAAGQDERTNLLCRAVTIIASMHTRGLQQEDAHLDNFLLQSTEGDERIILIDGADIQPVKPSAQQAQLENLALFFAQFSPKNDVLIKDACSLYCQTRHLPFSAELAAWMLKQTARKRRCRNQKFVEKSFRESTQFIQRKNWCHRMICQRDYDNAELQALLENPDRAIANGEMLKEGNSATVARVRVGALDLVIKRYNIKNAIHRLRRAFSPSRAAISWANAHRLNHCGIETPEAIAMLEERVGPLRGRAYIINQYVPGVCAAQFFADENPTCQKSKRLMQQFGEIFSAMANIRVSHGDFKASNFIISSDGQVMLIDLDSMRQHRNEHKFQVAFNKDMARFRRNWEKLPQVAAAFTEAGVIE